MWRLTSKTLRLPCSEVHLSMGLSAGCTERERKREKVTDCAFTPSSGCEISPNLKHNPEK
jgi:hypothetical protein